MAEPNENPDWQSAWERHEKYLRGYVIKLMQGPEGTDTVLNEARLASWKSWDKVRAKDEAGRRRYLCAIVHSKAMNWFNHRAKDPRTNLEITESTQPLTSEPDGLTQDYETYLKPHREELKPE